MRRVSMPGVFMLRKKNVSPLCFGALGSLRVTRMAHVGPVGARRPDLLAVDTQSSPSRTARVRSPARSEPAPGSEKSWHQTSSPRRAGRRVPPLLLLGAVGEQRRHAHAEADLEVAARHEVARLLLRVDDLVDRRQPAAAPVLRPVEARRSPASAFLAWNSLARSQALVRPPIAALPRLERAPLGLGVGGEERARLGAERGLFPGVGEVHGLSLVLRLRAVAPCGRTQASARASSRAMSRSFQRRALPSMRPRSLARR